MVGCKAMLGGHDGDMTDPGQADHLDRDSLLALANGYHSRKVRPTGTVTVAGHEVKTYAIEAPGRVVTDADISAAVDVAARHLASVSLRGSLGLAVVIFHAGGDGDYVLVHTWTEGYMSDLAVFVGPANDHARLRPGRSGLAPCVWEAAVLAYERDAFVEHLLAGNGAPGERLTAWREDTLKGDVR